MADFCYTLVSCNPALYPNLPNRCTEATHPYEGQVVYIVGQPTDETYLLQFNGIDTCVCVETMPTLGLTDFLVCDVDYCVYEMTNCFTGEKRTARFNVTAFNIWGVSTSNDVQIYDYVADSLSTLYSYAELIRAIAIDNANNVGYMLTTGGAMYSIDLTNPAGGTTFIANAATSGILGDATYQEDEKLIYTFNNTTNDLYQITKTGVTTNLGAITFTPSLGASGGGMAFNNKQELFVAAVGNLYLVDTIALTGTKLNTAAISTSGVISGLVWVKNLLFVIVDINGNIYSYDLNTETLTLLNTYAGNIAGIGAQTDRPVIGSVYKLIGDCGCWSITALSPTYDYTDVIETPYEDCATCLEAQQATVCPEGERTISYANRVKLPKVPVVDKGFNDCCFQLKVFADTSDTDDYKNDYTGFYDQKQLPSDTVDYVLLDSAGTPYAITDNTYGIYKDFGDYSENEKLKTFVIEWSKVLTLLGEGSYRFEKTVTVAGVAIVMSSNTFHLKTFSNALADNTIRLDAIQNGKLEHLGIDFKGTNFRTSLRVGGFFGRKQASYEQDNIVFSSYKSTQVSMDLKNEYQCQTDLLPSCITEDLFNFLLLANELFANDYNLNNHEYNYERLPIELSSADESDYYTYNRNARVNLKFTDRFKNKRKINC